jgi:hypothetical protein
MRRNKENAANRRIKSNSSNSTISASFALESKLFSEFASLDCTGFSNGAKASMKSSLSLKWPSEYDFLVTFHIYLQNGKIFWTSFRLNERRYSTYIMMQTRHLHLNLSVLSILPF